MRDGPVADAGRTHAANDGDDGATPGEGGATIAPASFSVRTSARAPELAGCRVELHADGSVVLVVDGERLFRFDSFEALLAQYQLVRGARQPLPAGGPMAEAWQELTVAEAAAAVEVAAIHSRPRAEKALAEDRLTVAVDRVRAARARIRELERTRR